MSSTSRWSLRRTPTVCLPDLLFAAVLTLLAAALLIVTLG